MTLRLLVLVGALVSACSAYDPELLRMRDAGIAGSGGAPGIDAGDNDAGGGECRVVPDSNCAIVCIERCNNLDDDCDGVIDNNSASSSCNIANGEAACDQGTCRLVRCQGDYADCNGDESDGCEVFLPNSPNDCGLCQAACTFQHGSARCFDGQCILNACEPLFGDCDGQPSNGCETSLTTLTTCGSCPGRCVVGANAIPSCATGVCEIPECIGRYKNCDGALANGCEQSLDDPDNCGECGVNCGTLPHATGTCGETGCEDIVCTGAYQDCNGLADDGCEALLSQQDNCGTCGMACDLPNVAAHLCDTTTTATCAIDDSAANGGCDPGFADCNGLPVDGCERPLNTTTDCGACAAACAFPNGLGSCDTGSCVFAGCDPGFEDCDGDDVCESLNADPNNCGGCDNLCMAPTLNCSGGRCRLVACPMNQADCNDDDVCEDLNTAANCGTCGAACPASLPNASGSCSTDGSCQLTCDAGFADCNGLASDGCETSTRTLMSCGGCGTTCSIANATATCASGACLVAMCMPTHDDCNGDDTSCETSLSLPTSCGSCTTDCTGKPNTTGAGCSGGACSFTCASGYRDCDALASNGCEVNINTLANCGSCGNNCSALMNVAMADCTTTGCDITACNAGFADCDGSPTNGCERAINTTTNCGGCNVACSYANAGAACTSGACAMGMCNTGFGDCDMTASNGCETQLNTTTHCGACGTACAMGQVCNNGMCASVNCPTGQSYCGGTTCIDITGNCPLWPGCLNQKANRDHCGACNNRCGLYSGLCCLGA